MHRATRTAALTAFVVLTAASAHSQGWYNYEISHGIDPALAQSPSNPINFTGFFSGPGGELYSTSVNGFSTNLGGGVSVHMLSMVSNGPAGLLSGLPGSTLVPGFAGSITTNYANGLYLNPAVAMPSAVAGRMSFDLGGGLSMDFLGALAKGPAGGFYFGPVSPFDNGFSTTVGTGFSVNFGHGGTLSLIGSVSRSYGPCSALSLAACR